jgi:hypothetical protein
LNKEERDEASLPDERERADCSLWCENGTFVLMQTLKGMSHPSQNVRSVIDRQCHREDYDNRSPPEPFLSEDDEEDEEEDDENDLPPELVGSEDDEDEDVGQ